MPLRLLSTDFDGTIFAEFENPPVPQQLQDLIAGLQANGAKWVINTGRDMSSLQEAVGRSHLTVQPDYLVLVEREIYRHDGSRYVADPAWNSECSRRHEGVFAQLRPLLPAIHAWINDRFRATLYEDSYSPFCLIAGNNGDADAIVAYLENLCRDIPDLVVVRNDIYMRFSHAAFNKGSALTEIARQLGVAAGHICAAGDHLNDLPMLRRQVARWLVAPSNAVPLVKEAVLAQGGYLSGQARGLGIADGLEWALRAAAPIRRPA
jgi:hydroxymethylpyrimidine pyrophosphatase-like HAD family hydrolase